jgi:hypothetical protein
VKTAKKKAAKKVTKKPASGPADAAEPTLSERERQHYEQIRELETECEKLESEFKDRKATATAAKSAWEAAVAQLRATIRSGPDAQLPLTFGDKGETPADDFMREDVMDALPGLTGKQVDALDDAGVRTIGELEALRAGAGLRSIKGFGTAVADKIEDLLLDYIAAQRKKEYDAAVAQGTDDEDEGGDE